MFHVLWRCVFLQKSRRTNAVGARKDVKSTLSSINVARHVRARWGASIRRRRSSRRVSTFCRRASWTGLGAQYASSVVAASGRYALARASSETHVALCIRLSIPGTTRQRDDKNRIIEFSMNLACRRGGVGRENIRVHTHTLSLLFLCRLADERRQSRVHPLRLMCISLDKSRFVRFSCRYRRWNAVKVPPCQCSVEKRVSRVLSSCTTQKYAASLGNERIVCRMASSSQEKKVEIILYKQKYQIRIYLNCSNHTKYRIKCWNNHYKSFQ